MVGIVPTNNLYHSGPSKHPQQDPELSQTSSKGVSQFSKTMLQSGVLGRKGQYAGKVLGVVQGDTAQKSGGLLGTAAASGLMGHKGRMAAHALGLGKQKGQGGVSVQNILGSGLLGHKGVVAGAAINLVKGKSNK